MTQTTEFDATLDVLRRHTIGAFNGSQVACAAPECRAWMKTDEWHRHVAGLIVGCPIPPEVCSTCGGSFDSPPCSLNRDLGLSGHTRAGGVEAAETRSIPPGEGGA